MANVLNTVKQIAIIGALAEGSSIRSIERITGVHRDTIMRLGVKVGRGCTAVIDATMPFLPTKPQISSSSKRLQGRSVESVPVRDVYKGETLWDGVVEVYDLLGHPKTHRAYAWSHDTDDPEHPKRHVTVLHIPPATSPQRAVMTAIAQEVRNARNQA